MLGRFTSRRIAAPELVPEPEASLASVDTVDPPAAPAPEPEPSSEPQSRASKLSEKLLDAKVRLHRRLIEEINL